MAGYGTAALLSYVVGQHYYPIRYPLRRIGLYVFVTAVLYAAMRLNEVAITSVPLRLLLNTGLIGLFAALIVRLDFPLGKLLKRLRRRG